MACHRRRVGRKRLSPLVTSGCREAQVGAGGDGQESDWRSQGGEAGLERTHMWASPTKRMATTAPTTPDSTGILTPKTKGESLMCDCTQ